MHTKFNLEMLPCIISAAIVIIYVVHMQLRAASNGKDRKDYDFHCSFAHRIDKEVPENIFLCVCTQQLSC